MDMDRQNGDLVFAIPSIKIISITDLQATKIGLVHEELYQHYHVDIIRNKFPFQAKFRGFRLFHLL